MSETITEFKIDLNSQQAVYYPGQCITGSVILEHTRNMDIHGLRLKFCGKGYCHWTDQVKVGDRQGKVTHLSKREIIKEVRCLFGSLQGKTTFSHPAGRQSYNFSFTVPNNIPSSFEDKVGYVRYILKATFANGSTLAIKCPIIVNDIIDTNLPGYMNSIGGEYSVSGSCSFIKSALTEINVSLDRACYCPGETILANVNVQNQTMTDLKSLQVQLLQTVEYMARDKSKTATKEICRLSLPVIPKGASKKFENQALAVPATVPSILNSSVISLSYELRVIDGARRGKNPYVKMNVMIGTIPFKLTYGTPAEDATSIDQEVAGKSFGPFRLSDLGYKDMPPASYSPVEGVVDVNIANRGDSNTLGKMLYTPVYTFARAYRGDS